MLLCLDSAQISVTAVNAHHNFHEINKDVSQWISYPKVCLAPKSLHPAINPSDVST